MIGQPGIIRRRIIGQPGMIGRPVIFGEVLFDMFPGGRRILGRAPFDVGQLQAFGSPSQLMIRRGSTDPETAAGTRAA